MPLWNQSRDKAVFLYATCSINPEPEKQQAAIKRPP